MTKETKKPQDKVTKAGAVELEENELNEVQGGIGYIKLGGIDGESLKNSRESIKLGDLEDTQKLATDYLKFGDLDGKTLKR